MKMSDKAANAQIKTLNLDLFRKLRELLLKTKKNYMKVRAPWKQIVTTSGVAKEIYTEL